jgi:hypothetical protein
MKNISNKRLMVEIASELAKSKTKIFFTEDDIWEFLYAKNLDINGNDLFNECCNNLLFEEQGFNSDSGFLEDDLVNIYCEPVIVLRRSLKAKTPAPLLTQNKIEELLAE